MFWRKHNANWITFCHPGRSWLQFNFLFFTRRIKCNLSYSWFKREVTSNLAVPFGMVTSLHTDRRLNSWPSGAVRTTWSWTRSKLWRWQWTSGGVTPISILNSTVSAVETFRFLGSTVLNHQVFHILVYIIVLSVIFTFICSALLSLFLAVMSVSVEVHWEQWIKQIQISCMCTHTRTIKLIPTLHHEEIPCMQSLWMERNTRTFLSNWTITNDIYHTLSR